MKILIFLMGMLVLLGFGMYWNIRSKQIVPDSKIPVVYMLVKDSIALMYVVDTTFKHVTIVSKSGSYFEVTDLQKRNDTLFIFK